MLMIKRSEVTCIKDVGISEEMSVLFVKDVHRDLETEDPKGWGYFLISFFFSFILLQI